MGIPLTIVLWSMVTQKTEIMFLPILSGSPKDKQFLIHFGFHCPKALHANHKEIIWISESRWMFNHHQLKGWLSKDCLQVQQTAVWTASPAGVWAHHCIARVWDSPFFFYQRSFLNGQVPLSKRCVAEKSTDQLAQAPDTGFGPLILQNSNTEASCADKKRQPYKTGWHE